MDIMKKSFLKKIKSRLQSERIQDEIAIEHQLPKIIIVQVYIIYVFNNLKPVNIYSIF